MIAAPLILLADSTAPPPGFSDFISSAFYVVGLITAVVVLVRQMKAPVKQQREIVGDSITVKSATIHATRAEVDELKREMSELRARLNQLHDHIDARNRELLDAGEKRQNLILDSIGELRDALHNRVTDTMGRVAHLEGRMEAAEKKSSR